MIYRISLAYIICIIFVCKISYAQGDIQKKSWKDKTTFSAIANSRTSYELSSGKFSKSELFIIPELEIQVSKNLRFVAIGRAYIEFLDNVEPLEPMQDEVSGYSQRKTIGDLTELEIRELYIDYKIGKHYLTIGKQQTVWGEADGLKLLDVVNPMNMREFFFDDFDYSRIPLWTIKADLDFNKVKAQLIFIPDQTYHDIPDINGLFFPYAFFPQPSNNGSIIQLGIKKPDHILEDADAGVKLSTFTNGWDLSLNYLYHYDDFPVAEIQISNNNIVVQPVYKRHHILGGTFNNSFNSVTIKGEAALSIDKWFMTPDVAISSGIFKTNQLAIVVGIDYSGISNTLFSFQLFGDYILKDIKLIGRQQFESNITMLFSRNFKNETITTELLALQNINFGDGFLRPSIKWTANNRLILSVGGDIIYGNPQRLFGQYSSRSRLNVGIQIGL